MPGQDLAPISVNTRHSPARAPAYLLQRDGVEAFSANLTGKVMPVLPFFFKNHFLSVLPLLLCRQTVCPQFVSRTAFCFDNL